MSKITPIIDTEQSDYIKVYWFWSQLDLSRGAYLLLRQLCYLYAPHGICEDPLSVIAKKVDLSVNTLRRYKLELTKKHHILGYRSLITVEERWDEGGSRLPDLITVGDQDRLAEIYEELK